MIPYPKIESLLVRDTETFNLIEGRWRLPEFEYLKDNLWEFEEKLHGCLHWRQRILTDRGTIPVGKIVNQEMDVRVASYNFDMEIVEFKEIEVYHKEKCTEPFMRVVVKSRFKGSKPKHIICTNNHKFWVGDSWVEAKDLKPGMRARHVIDKFPEETVQIVLGGLLGDSSIYRPSKTTRGFSFIHSIEQKDYFNWKVTLLGDIFNECRGTRGGFKGSKKNKRGNAIINPFISELILTHCEKNGSKEVGRRWLDRLNPLGIAIWYMDDGSCSFNEKQRPRARFSTQGFTLKEVKLLSECLKKWNIENSIHYSNGYYMTATADGTERLFNIIFPFIPKSMKYKIDPKYRKYPCVLTENVSTSYSGIIETDILSIDNKIPDRYNANYQYDIQVRDNSNYFVSSILAHNTNVRVLFDYVTSPLGLGAIPVPSVEFRGRTDKAQMPTFLFDKLTKLFPAEKLQECFGEQPATLYGEGFGKKLQSLGSSYIPDGVDFALFDIRIGNWWLKREDVKAIAKTLGITTTHVIGKGTLEEAITMAKEGFNSQWGDFRAEGLVVRPIVPLQMRNGRRIIGKVKYCDFNKGK